MNKYRVVWEIDIEADDTQQAALEAERTQLAQIQRDNGAQRGVFAVTDKETGVEQLVDLSDTDEVLL